MRQSSTPSGKLVGEEVEHAVDQHIAVGAGGCAAEVEPIDVPEPRRSRGGAVRQPRLRAIRNVTSAKEALLSEQGEVPRVRVLRPRVDVEQESGAGGRAVQEPRLTAALRVSGTEDQLTVAVEVPLRVGARLPGVDVGQQLGAAPGAIGCPRLPTYQAVISGEVHPSIEGEQRRVAFDIERSIRPLERNSPFNRSVRGPELRGVRPVLPAEERTIAEGADRSHAGRGRLEQQGDLRPVQARAPESPARLRRRVEVEPIADDREVGRI